MLFVTKTLDDEWYLVIKAFKFTVFEISFDLSTKSQHIESSNFLIMHSVSLLLYRWSHCHKFGVQY